MRVRRTSVRNRSAQGGHGPDGEQAVARAEQVGDEALGIADVPAGHPLLELPHVAGHGLDVGFLIAGERRDDGVRQLEDRLGTEPPRHDSRMDRPRLAKRHRRVDRRVDGPVDSHQVVPADDLVELNVVHVAALPALRSVQHDQHVVAVAVDLRHAIALDAVPHRQGMKAEHLQQRARAVFVATGDVDPDEPGVTPEQCCQLVRGPVLDALIGDQANLHLSHLTARSTDRASPELSTLRRHRI